MTDPLFAEKWTAEAVKEKLRKRYPATQMMGSARIPGPWITVEEWQKIDLLAIGVTGGTGRKWIAHEIKVSRSDFRAEILNPTKRDPYKAYSHALYFVVPDGLLKPEEISHIEPEYNRNARCDACEPRRGKSKQRVPVPAVRQSLHRGLAIDHSADWKYITCAVCDGTYNPEFAQVVRESPTLWVPRDVGLIVVNSRGQKEVKSAPSHNFGEALAVYPALRRDTQDGLDLAAVADLARWISARPDPRHDGVVKAAREVQAGWREDERRWREDRKVAVGGGER